MYPDFLNAFEQHYYIYPNMDDGVKKNFLWNELEANLANIDEDIIIEDAVGIELGLESGDVDIVDTLYQYFTDEYRYIEMLAKYLKQWIRTIRIRDIQPKTNFINKVNDSLYITFNYTAVLETVYDIEEEKVIHIHGSLRQRDGDPVLGHGSKDRIYKIQEKLQEAEDEYDEKEVSICKVIKDYYMHTFKDINRYMYKLQQLKGKEVEEVVVIGHSVAGVDMPYFRSIDIFLKQKVQWIIYYFSKDEKDAIYQRMIKCGIDSKRLNMRPAMEFYNM